MHKNHQKTQYDECLICQSPALFNISFVQLIKPLPLCPHCLSQFEIIDKTIDFHHYPLRILYAYNEFFRSLLFQYKGLYDYALKDAFLCTFNEEIKREFHDYLIVVPPSWKEENSRRGFAPIESIAYTFSSHVFTGLYKKVKYKQSQLSLEERIKVSERIGIRHKEELKGKKVLIFDDVYTSGSTLEACLNIVLAQEPSEVQLLVLASKKFLSF